MDTDAPRPIAQHDAPDLWRLPDVLDVRIRWRRFDAPRRVTVAGKDTFYEAAVEIELQVSEPFQIRALGPVLWVGDEALTIADNPADGVYRFYAFAPDELRDDAPLALSWHGAQAPRKELKHTYSPPQRK